jgi:hypothetical protein
MTMTTTPAGDDSDWNDLASELGIETKPVPKPYDSVPAGFEAQQTPGEPPPFPDVPWPGDPTALLEPGLPTDESDLPDAESHDDQDTMVEPLLANEEFAAEEGEGSEGDGPPGTGKRRRRRRRRRKGGPDGAVEGGPEGEAVAEGTDVNDADPEAEVEPTIPVETRTTADAIRELVRNWNVPGWNDVVAGLYRPGGDRA